jgi:hypothetical protein
MQVNENFAIVAGVWRGEECSCFVSRETFFRVTCTFYLKSGDFPVARA